MKILKSSKTVWTLNFVLLASVVFLGIQQGGKGAELAKMENELKNIQIAKHSYTEAMLVSSNTDQISQKAMELGFGKPIATVYIDGQDMLTSNLVR